MTRILQDEEFIRLNGPHTDFILHELNRASNPSRKNSHLKQNDS